MYLVTFTFILLSVLGLYSQLYLLQSAKIFERQSGVAQIMRTWHDSAYLLARANPAIVATAAGCRLTNTALYAFAAPALCTNGGPVFVQAANLPTGYQLNPYTWKSVVLLSGGSRILVTYATVPAGGNMGAPLDGPIIGYTLSDLYKQMQSAGMSQVGYGPVVAGVAPNNTLITKSLNAAGAQVTYTVPAALMPVGTVAYVSGF